jgi:hypothetical protein
MNLKRSRYIVEIVDGKDPRIAEYLQSIESNYPLSYRVIFTKTRIIRCRCAALLVRTASKNSKAKIAGITGLALTRRKNPVLLFIWVEPEARMRQLDRHLLIDLRTAALKRYGAVPDSSELLRLCTRIILRRQTYQQVRENTAVGLAYRTKDRLTSSSGPASITSTRTQPISDEAASTAQ